MSLAAGAIRAAWIIGTYSGDEAKRVKTQAESGIGYFIASEYGKGQGYGIEAAFRAAGEILENMPDNCRLATEQQAAKLDRELDRRTGAHRRPEHTAIEAAKLAQASLIDAKTEAKYSQAMRKRQAERPELL